MTTTRAVAALWLVICLLFPASGVLAEEQISLFGREQTYVIVGAGAFDITDSDHTTAEGRIEFAPGYRILRVTRFFRGFGPMVGLMGNANGGVFGYGGIFADIRLGDRVVVRPQFGVGGYREGGSKDLGGVFELHLGGEIAYRFDSDHRVGVMITHISNNEINHDNPGENGFLLTYSVPLQALF